MKREVNRQNKKEVETIMNIFYDLIERDSWVEKAFHDWELYFSSVNFCGIAYSMAIIVGIATLKYDAYILRSNMKSIILLSILIVLPVLARLMVSSFHNKLTRIAKHQTNVILTNKKSQLLQKLKDNNIS